MTIDTSVSVAQALRIAIAGRKSPGVLWRHVRDEHHTEALSLLVSPIHGMCRKGLQRVGRYLRCGPLAAASIALWPIAAARADTFAFDRGHTNVSFSWDRLAMSRQSGRILDVAGTLELDPANPEQGQIEVTMKATSIWTGFEPLDKHLRSADFFDAARHPLITFKSTSVHRTGEKTGTVDGDLTIMGTTKPVALHVRWNFFGDHPLGRINPTYQDKIATGFTATGKLLRSDWGLNRGVPLVSDEIELSINVEMLKK